MTTDKPSPGTRIPEFRRFELIFLVAVIVGALGVGALGLVASFDTVEQAAREWGFQQPWILPVAVDISIPVFSLSHLLLIRADIPLGWVRAIPWGLTAVTVYLNIAAVADRPLPAQLGHGALPLLWVACSEIAAHVYRAIIGKLTGRRMERVRKSRWLLAPVSTVRLWRRMILWEVTSYRTALTLEEKRLMARAEMRDRHGRLWRRKVTRKELVRLHLGELEPAAPELELERGPELEPRELELGLEPLRELGPAEPEPVASAVWNPGTAEPEPEPTVRTPAEPEPEPELVNPNPSSGRHSRTGTANLGDRATKKNAQVTAVLNLISELGRDAVTIPLVMDQLNVAKSTAYSRILAARDEWDQRVAS